jgi:hypothetical protein
MKTKRTRAKSSSGPQWRRQPAKPGFYIVFQRGRGFDVLFWPGHNDPAYEIDYTKQALYFGPFKLPLSV